MHRRWLLLFLRFVGGVALLAFAAAIMPAKWMIETSEAFGLTMPDEPLAFYLARNLSLLYGYVGAGLLVIAADLPRYRPQVRLAAYGTITFAVAQWVVDSMAAMPAWWTLGESGSTLVGGVLLWWLDRATEPTCHGERATE